MTRPRTERQRAPGWLAIASRVLVASAFVATVPLVAAAQPATPPRDPKALEEAKKHWEAGQAFYNDPSGKHNCEDAVREFSKAYELSGSVKAARARGICEMELEQDGAAIADFDLYLGNRPKDAGPDEIAQVESDEKRLKAVVADVVIHSDKPNTRITSVRQPAQGLPITNRYLAATDGTSLKIHPGSYTFTAQAEGAPDVSWTADIQPSSQNAHSIDFAAAVKAAAQGKLQQPVPTMPVADEGTRPIPVVAWVFGAVTVAAIVPTVAAGVLALQAKSAYNAKNGKASTATLTPLRSDVITKAAVSDVFLGVTIAAAITTTVFIITRPTVHKKIGAAPTMSVAVAPTFDEGTQALPQGGGVTSTSPTPNGAVMVLSGSF